MLIIVRGQNSTDDDLLWVSRSSRITMACEVEKSVPTALNGQVNIEEVRAAKEVGVSPNLDSK